MNKDLKIFLVVLMSLIVLGLILPLLVNADPYITYGNIKDNNNGREGDILVNTGIDSGGSDIGTWIDASFLKGDKGDKGDTGATGAKGDKGDKGEDGKDVDPQTVLDLQKADSDEIINRELKDMLLQSSIDETNNKSIDRDKELQSSIDSEIGLRQYNDNLLASEIQIAENNLVIETKERKKADKILQSNIDNETFRAVSSENILQNNINTVNNNSINRDNVLQTNINKESEIRYNADQVLQSNINNVSSRVDNLDKRVGKLEKTQYKVEVGIRVLDTKRVTITPYASQNFTRNKVDEVGVRVTFKLGQSYEEKLIAKQNLRLEAIEKKIGNAPILETVVNQKGEVQSMRISESGITVNKKF